MAQSMDINGSLRWDNGPVPISTYDVNWDNMKSELVAVSNGAGSAIAAWKDARVSQTYNDIYAQEVRGAAATPIIIKPESGQVDVYCNPQLEASSFFAPGIGVAHSATEWQLDDDSDFSSPEWTRLSSGGETSTVVDGAHGTFGNDLAGRDRLEPNKSYALRVRYQDSRGDWSSYGSTFFITASTTWYLAEGCTEGGFETWILVQNPGNSDAAIDMVFQTDQGTVQGPKDTIPAGMRRSYNLINFVQSYDVSTMVTADYGSIVCGAGPCMATIVRGATILLE